MRRYALIPLFGLAGCVTSPVYVPGLHTAAPLRSKGSVIASYITKAPRGHETQIAALVTDRWFVRAGYISTADGPEVRNSHVDVAVGRVTRDSGSQLQRSIGFSTGDGRTAIASLTDWANYEGAPYMAAGNYSRLYLQQSMTIAMKWLEFGGSARLSAVRVSQYRRWAGTWHANQAVGGPYTRDTTFTGSLSGLFAEPGVFVGVNFRGIRVTPQLSFAMPLTSTAFGAMPAEAGVTFGFDSDFLKRWSK